MRLNKEYAKNRLERLCRDIQSYTYDEFVREMTGTIEGSKELEWREAEYPKDHGREARFCDGGELWIYSTLVGYNGGDWIVTENNGSGYEYYTYCEVKI